MQAWTLSDMREQTGRTAIVTGANTGIGYKTARILAEKGSSVMLACRDLARAEAAAQRIRAGQGSASVGVVALDLDDAHHQSALCVTHHQRLSAQFTRGD